MKSSNPAAAPRNANANHPPLARNAQGHPVSLPDGAAWWGIKRQTRGRPKWIVGPDRRPYRLPLDATEEDIAETFGPGTYRLDALDDVGNVLDYVTTVEIAGDEADDDEARGSVGARRGPSSDLRFALETILQMSRAQADALRAVSEAQADWVKGLASARMLPRNAVYVAPPALAAPEEDDDEDDDEPDESEESSPSWVTAAEGIIRDVAPAVGAFVSTRWPRNAAVAAPSAGAAAPIATAPSGPNPMVHLADINERLTEPERRVLLNVLRKPNANVVTQALLALSVDDAVEYVTDMIARARAGDEPASAPPSAAPTEDFMAHAAAIAALLSAEERAAILALLPSLSVERREQLEAQLLAMEPEAAAAWVREHLPELCAEVEP